MKHAVNGRAGGTVGAGQLAEALAALAIPADGGAIEVERRASDTLAFEPGAADGGAHSLDDRLRSSSAIAPMITTMARPSGPPVSICSRNDTNSTLRRFSSSRKW